MAALSHWEMGLYPFTLNLLRLCNCFNNRLWWFQTLETSNFYFLSFGMETSNVYFLSLGMLVLEETSCHVTGLAMLRVPCLWEFQAPWRGPTGWDVMWRKSQAKGHWGTRQTRERASWEWMLLPQLPQGYHLSQRWTIHLCPSWVADQQNHEQ